MTKFELIVKLKWQLTLVKSHKPLD